MRPRTASSDRSMREKQRIRTETASHVPSGASVPAPLASLGLEEALPPVHRSRPGTLLAAVGDQGCWRQSERLEFLRAYR
jgi:hypothetical protein